MSEELKIENTGHVRTIILNRPKIKNALNDALAWGIIGALEAAAAGLGLTMATDARIIAKSAGLMAGYTHIGGSPDAGLTITLPQTMGYEKARQAFMEKRTPVFTGK